jgi:taurine dioxygenase
MTGCIIGLSPADSDALLEDLFGYLYAADHVQEQKWQLGDLVLWDNLAVQHARREAAFGERTLQRVTIAEMGYARQYPSDQMGSDLHNDTLLTKGEASVHDA